LSAQGVCLCTLTHHGEQRYTRTLRRHHAAEVHCAAAAPRLVLACKAAWLRDGLAAGASTMCNETRCCRLSGVCPADALNPVCRCWGCGRCRASRPRRMTAASAWTRLQRCGRPPLATGPQVQDHCLSGRRCNLVLPSLSQHVAAKPLAILDVQQYSSTVVAEHITLTAHRQRGTYVTAALVPADLTVYQYMRCYVNDDSSKVPDEIRQWCGPWSHAWPLLHIVGPTVISC
jgi:hypothetical protein